MPAPSLKSMAIRLCQRRVDDIDDLGDLSYTLVEPIIRKIQNPAHLIELQEKSPHIAYHTQPLWLEFIKRDISKWEEKMGPWKEKMDLPRNKNMWWKLHRKLKREEQKAKDKDVAELAEAMSGIAQKRVDDRTRFIQEILPDPDPLMRPSKASPKHTREWPGKKPSQEGARILKAVKKEVQESRLSRGPLRPQKPRTPADKVVARYFTGPLTKHKEAQVAILSNQMINSAVAMHAKELEERMRLDQKNVIAAMPKPEPPKPSVLPVRHTPIRASSSRSRSRSPKQESPIGNTTPPNKMSIAGAAGRVEPLAPPNHAKSPSKPSQSPPSTTSPMSFPQAQSSSATWSENVPKADPAAVAFLKRRHEPVSPFIPSKRARTSARR